MEIQELNLLKTFSQALAQQSWRSEDISGEGHSLFLLISHMGWAPDNYYSVLDGNSQRHLPECLQIICYTRSLLLVALVMGDSILQRCLLLGLKEQTPPELWNFKTSLFFLSFFLNRINGFCLLPSIQQQVLQSR